MRRASKRGLALIVVPVLAACALAGCGGSDDNSPSTSQGAAAPGAGAAAAPDAIADSASKSASGSAGSNGKTSASDVSGSASVAALTAAASRVSRKIIYTAQVELVSENLSTAQTNLARLVRANKGYIAENTVGAESGSERKGTWKVRVPVERYDAFMAGATRLGELQSVHSDSQDVSEEYFDVAARISNKQVEEKRLLEHLRVSTGRLREILEIEREISRVRGEIERFQGRIRVLANLTALATVTVTISEIKNYVPPRPPTFATQAERAFSGSMEMLRETAKASVLCLVALLPWLLIGALIGLPFWTIRRAKARAAQLTRGAKSVAANEKL